MTTSKKPQQLQELETLIVLATFLLVLYLFLHKSTLVISAIILLLIGLFAKPLASVISRIWLRFAEILGAFNSKIILTAVFFLFLTPIALMYRIFKKNPLQVKLDKHTRSLFVERNHLYNKSDFEKTW